MGAFEKVLVVVNDDRSAFKEFSSEFSGVRISESIIASTRDTNFLSAVDYYEISTCDSGIGGEHLKVHNLNDPLTLNCQTWKASSASP